MNVYQFQIGEVFNTTKMHEEGKVIRFEYLFFQLQILLLQINVLNLHENVNIFFFSTVV